MTGLPSETAQPGSSEDGTPVRGPAGHRVGHPAGRPALLLASTRAELHVPVAETRAGGGRVAFVPTMGALHEGHASLMRTARSLLQPGDLLVVSVFVNPMQFGQGEDLDRYPRTLDADLDVCAHAGADVVFAPSVAEVYPGGDPQVTVDPGPMAGVLEGAVRPTHFRGVLTVVAKLFGLVRPDLAVFGQKDYQQLTLVRRMVADLCLGIDVVGAETVREADGLALSSRNRYLSADERVQGLALSAALRAGVEAGPGGAHEVRRAALAVLAAAGVEPDYVEVTDPDLGPPVSPGPARLLVAAKVGSTRLIDNAAVTLGGSVTAPLLCADIGNSHTTVGLLVEREVTHHWRVNTDERRTADEWGVLLRALLDAAGAPEPSSLRGVAVCSTVPSVLHEWRQMFEDYYASIPHVVVEAGVKTGVPVLMDNPREVGSDRIVNALAAASLFDGPSIVVDFGTATTFDVVSPRGEYVGGAISPGIEISLEALGRRGAQLRKVELLRPRSVIAKNTVEALQSGVLYGFASQVDGMVARMTAALKHQPGEVNVIATGGLAPLVVDECASITEHQPWLTLMGLELVFARNT